MSALPIIGLVGSFVTGFVLGKIASDNENLRKRLGDIRDSGNTVNVTIPDKCLEAGAATSSVTTYMRRN